MSTVLAHYRNGTIELDGPPPADWTDGAELRIALEEPVTEIDIIGDSPEAIAAWFKWYEDLHAQTRDSKFPEELECFLAEQKAVELAGWEEQGKKMGLKVEDWSQS